MVVLSSWFVALVTVAGLCVSASRQARNEWSPALGNQVLLPNGALTFRDAQSHFYNARYEAAAALTLALRGSQPQDLANDELRTSALLFQLKGLLEQPADKHSNRKEADKKEALRMCVPCPTLIAAFMADIEHGKALARGRLEANSGDDEALFFLGKLNLNYVWLQLGPLGRKTGWDEYLGGPADRWTSSSSGSHSTSARSSRAPGSITSWTPGCRGAPSGCSAGAAGSERLRPCGQPRTSRQISLRIPKRRSRCGRCRCGNAT